jgi:methylthioribulose 1-phosphate dehydratase / enolase-phosphatase E1
MAHCTQVPPVKDLQGMIWKTAYESGDLRGEVYPDVPLALKRWQAQGHRVAIYSSGSRAAQRLLFAHSTAGDLTPCLSAYFDITTAGRKAEAASYAQIALSLGVVQLSDVLFVTDVLAEAEAARAAGCSVVISVRPGNAALPEGHGFDTVTSFDSLLA